MATVNTAEVLRSALHKHKHKTSYRRQIGIAKSAREDEAAERGGRSAAEDYDSLVETISFTLVVNMHINSNSAMRRMLLQLFFIIHHIMLPVRAFSDCFYVVSHNVTRCMRELPAFSVHAFSWRVAAQVFSQTNVTNVKSFRVALNEVFLL